eukprot:983823-Alexandrium_andersonii.AAC.1
MRRQGLQLSGPWEFTEAAGWDCSCPEHIRSLRDRLEERPADCLVLRPALSGARSALRRELAACRELISLQAGGDRPVWMEWPSQAVPSSSPAVAGRATLPG